MCAYTESAMTIPSKSRNMTSKVSLCNRISATAGLDVQYEPTKNQFSDEPEGLQQFRDHRWKALGKENPDLPGIFSVVICWPPDLDISALSGSIYSMLRPLVTTQCQWYTWHDVIWCHAFGPTESLVYNHIIVQTPIVSICKQCNI